MFHLQAPPVLGPLKLRVIDRIDLAPTLDRVGLVNPLSRAQDGPVVPEPIISSTGHLLPIEL